jgi:hypothetical protein
MEKSRCCQAAFIVAWIEKAFVQPSKNLLFLAIPLFSVMLVPANACRGVISAMTIFEEFQKLKVSTIRNRHFSGLVPQRPKRYSRTHV